MKKEVLKMKLFKIKWDKQINMTQKILFLILTAWMCASFIFGVLIGLIF